jgi:hypothetical protein
MVTFVLLASHALVLQGYSPCISSGRSPPTNVPGLLSFSSRWRDCFRAGAQGIFVELNNSAKTRFYKPEHADAQQFSDINGEPRC